MRAKLPPAVVKQIAWDEMEDASEALLDPNHKKSQCDLLFRVPIGSVPSLIYLHLEHQSQTDTWMPVRMLGYVAGILMRYVDQLEPHQPKRLPLLIPVVVSHDPNGWRAACDLHSLHSELPDGFETLHPYRPSMSFLLDDLSRLEDEELRERGFDNYRALALWALRDARNPQRLLEKLLQPFGALVAELAQDSRGRQALQEFFRYTAHTSQELKIQSLVAVVRTVAPDAERLAMTIAETHEQIGEERGLKKGRAEGRAEGRTEGRTEGAANVLRKLLLIRFQALSPEAEAKIDQASFEQLEAWAERVLISSSLDDVVTDT